MIDKRRQLCLMCSCSIIFNNQKAQDSYAERFVEGLSQEEVEFCLEFIKKDYKVIVKGE